MNAWSRSRKAVTAFSKHRSVRLGLAVALMAFTGADSAYWERCTPQPKKIFSGVTYGCERLERTEQGTASCIGCASNSTLRESSFT
jgi:hypothetical protein